MLPKTRMPRLFPAMAAGALLFSAPLAVAQPDAPDVDFLPAAQEYDYLGGGIYQHSFRPAPDVWCAMNYTRFSNSSSCIGNLPGVPSGQNRVSAGWDMNTHTGYAQFGKTAQPAPDADLRHFYRALPRGQALRLSHNYEVAGHVCGSPAGYLVVCRIDSAPRDLARESHGFVLSDRGSWTF